MPDIENPKSKIQNPKNTNNNFRYMEETKKRQFNLKKIAKRICWYLIVTVIANFIGIFMYVPKKVYAVATLRPNSDVTTQWDASTEATHYQAVNSAGINDATQLTNNDSVDDDLFGLPDGQIPSGSNVTQIQVFSRVHDKAGKQDTFKLTYDIGGGIVAGAEQNFPDAYTTMSETWSGLTWDDTDIDALQIGIRHFTDVGGNIGYCSWIYVEVTYYAISTLTTDSGSYPTLGETITVDSTVENGSSAIVSGSTGDYVIFIDGDADNTPDPGETYMYTTSVSCDTSGIFGTDGPDYTDRWSVPDVAVDGTQSEQWTCDNSNFPQNTTYHIWMKWYSGGTTYDTTYVTFTSVPTLTEILFIILVGCAVFLAIKTGVIKFKKQKDPDPKDIKIPPIPPVKQNLDNHQEESQSFRKKPSSRSVDGITLKQNRKNYDK